MCIRDSSCTQFITLVNDKPFLIVDTECRSFGFPSTGNTILVPNPAFDPVFNPLVPEELPVGPHSALDDVEWPCDIELTTCGLGLTPDDLEADFPQDARPYLSEDACGNIGVGFEDLTLPVQGDACIKILRTWTIIDWCQFEVGNSLGDGIWEYVQVIEVINSLAPNVNCSASDSSIGNFEENCGATFVNLFIDACLLYTSPSPRDATLSRMPSSA